MTLAKEDVHAVLDIYMQAWAKQDPDLITTIFTPAATYHERVLDEPMYGRDGIRAYWQEKVVESQANITCRLLHLYLDGETAIAEWEAEFDDLRQRVRKRMREVAILEFDGRLIASLREYWSSQEVSGEHGVGHSAHLLRSPANAHRLRTAIDELEGGGSPTGTG